MTGKENHFEAAEMTAARTNENRAKTPPEIPLGPILNDLVTFADELNTRNISEAAANQSYRTILLRWLRLTFILSLFLTAILLVFIYLFYCAFAKLALTAHDEIKLVASQAAMLEEQRTIADGVLAAMRAQLNEQIAADRPALIPNGIVPIKLGTFPQSWTQVETKNGPPETVAVGWHNFGNAIATDFVQMGRLMLGKAGDPSPVNPECEDCTDLESKIRESLWLPITQCLVCGPLRHELI